MDPIRPSQRHWDALAEAPDFQLISLQDFCERWLVTKKEVAKITRTSYQTARQWFYESGRKPKFEQLVRLTRAHRIWCEIDHIVAR